jgi:hypothetical protein
MRWFVVVAALVSGTVACSSSESRDRNAKVLTGQTCRTLGQTKTVAKIVNVCGRQGDALVWYAATSPKPNGAKCSRPGGFRKSGARSLVCATYKGKRMWIEVAPLPGLVSPSSSLPVGESSASPSTTTAPVAPVVESAIASKPIDPSQALSVAKASTPATRLALTTKATTSSNGLSVSPTPIVQLVDDSGSPRPIAGVKVRVVVGDGERRVVNGEAETSADGIAKFPGLSLLGEAGRVDLVFVADGLDGVSQSLDHAVGAPAALTVVKTPGVVTAGATWLGRPVIQVVDAAGESVPQPGIDVELSSILGKSGATVLAQATTDDDGVAAFTSAHIDTVGAWQVAVTSTTPSLAADPFDVTVTAADASSLRVDSPLPVSMLSGIPYDGDFSVQVVDAFGNDVATEGLEVELSTSREPGDVRHSLSPTKATTDENGVATFENVTVSGRAGTFSFSVAAVDDTVAPIDIENELKPGPAARLAVVVDPRGARSGSPLDVAPQVALVDEAGNRVKVEGGTVTAVALDGVALANSTAAFNDEGVAVFDGLTLTGTVGMVQLTFVYRLFAATTTVALDNGALTTLSAVELPTRVTAGEKFTVRVGLRDAQGNGVLDEGIVVRGRLGTGDPQWAVVSGNTGTVDFAEMSFVKAGVVPVSFEALSGSGQSLLRLTGQITVVAADAATVEFPDAADIAAKSGTAFPAGVKVRVVDSLGNVVEKPGTKVSATVTASNDPAAKLVGVEAVTDDSGTATFGALVLTGKTGAYGISFGVANGESVAYPKSVTLAAGAPHALEIVRLATGLVNGQFATVQPVIQVVDSAGNSVPASGVVVVAEVDAVQEIQKRGEATTNSSGRATFSNLKMQDLVGYTKALRYKATIPASGNTLTTSQAVVVQPGLPSYVVASIVSDGYIPSGQAVGSVSAYDAQKNQTSLIGYSVEVAAFNESLDNPETAVWLHTFEYGQIVDGRLDLSKTRLYGTAGAKLGLRVKVSNRSGFEVTSWRYLTFSTGPRVGDPGPAGGYVVGSLATYAAVTDITNGGRYMEIAPLDLEGVAQINPANFFDLGSDSAKAKTSVRVGTGATNTKALVDAVSSSYTDYAARLVANASIRGRNDWFVPSRDELVLIYEKLAKTGVVCFCDGVPTMSSSVVTGNQFWAVGPGDLPAEVKPFRTAVRMLPVRVFG